MIIYYNPQVTCIEDCFLSLSLALLAWPMVGKSFNSHDSLLIAHQHGTWSRH